MTKKDYELIAGVIMSHLPESIDAATGVERAKMTEFAEDLSGELHKSNPKFNKDKFLTACGIKD